MDDPVETMKEENNEMSHKTRKHHRVLAFVRRLQEFGNQVAQIKIKWLLSGMLVFLVSVIFTQLQFNAQDKVARAQIEDQRLRDHYLSDLTNYNSAVVARALCVDGVDRSDLNRAQWLSLANIVALLPASDAPKYSNEILGGPLFSRQPRTVDDCPVIPLVPVPPDKEAYTQGQNLPSNTTTP